MTRGVSNAQQRALNLSGRALARDVIPDSVIDHFNDTLYKNRGKSISDYYSGNLSDFIRQESTVYSGSHALECDPTDAVAITSTSGLNNYPTKGNKFQYWSYATDNSINDTYVGFGIPSESGYDRLTGYFVTLEPTGGQFRIRRFDDGTPETLTTESNNPPVNEWIRYEIYWQENNDIDVTVYDTEDNQISLLSTNDNNYQGNGIGFVSVNNDNPVYWDNIKLI